jgi:hypothetical protein
MVTNIECPNRAGGKSVGADGNDDMRDTIARMNRRQFLKMRAAITAAPP